MTTILAAALHVHLFAALAADSAAGPISGPVRDDNLVKVRKVEHVRFRRGSGFELATADDRFLLQIRARLQVRYDFENPAIDQQSLHTLQIRRARLQFQGNVFGKNNRYYIQLGFSPRDMLGGLIDTVPALRRNPLRDARLEFNHVRDLNLWVGQMKVPFSRQRVISSGDQQILDRTAVNEEFNLDRDVGFQLRSEDLGGIDRLSYQIGVFFGQGRNTFEPKPAGFLYVARVEYQPFGDFVSDMEVDLERLPKPRLSLGTAYAFHDNAPGNRSIHGQIPSDGGTTDLHHTTTDLMFKWRGLSVLSAFHLRKARRRNPGTVIDSAGEMLPIAAPRDGLGWFAQAGYLIPKTWLEPVARYSSNRNVYGARSALSDRDEAGGGLNYFFVGHNFKLQADYFRIWDGMWPQVKPGTAGFDRVRVQIQVAF